MEGPFDTKVAIVLLDELAVWQKAKAAAFLVSGIAATVPDLMGRYRLPEPST